MQKRSQIDQSRAAENLPLSDAAEDGISSAIQSLIDAVEGIDGAMNYGTFRSERGSIRLKDTPEWVAFYVAAKGAK